MAQSRFTFFNLLHSLKLEHELYASAERKALSTTIKRIDQISNSMARSLGQHTLAEFRCPETFKAILNASNSPEQIIHDLIFGAAQRSQATILKHHAFKQYGSGNIAGIVVIEESHFCIHYRKDTNLISVDAFTCGEIDLEAGMQFIENSFGISAFDKINFKRGIYQSENRQFLPGIATQSSSHFTFLKPQAKPMQAAGSHFISEFYLCHPHRVNQASFVLDTFEESILQAGGTVDFKYVHEFKPQGISAVIMGDGYHLTIHDWPELPAKEYGAYAAIDLCNFNNKLNSEQVLDLLQERFRAEQVSTCVVPRGVYSMELDNFEPAFSTLAPKQS